MQRICTLGALRLLQPLRRLSMRSHGVCGRYTQLTKHAGNYPQHAQASWASARGSSARYKHTILSPAIAAAKIVPAVPYQIMLDIDLRARSRFDRFRHHAYGHGARIAASGGVRARPRVRKSRPDWSSAKRSGLHVESTPVNPRMDANRGFRSRLSPPPRKGMKVSVTYVVPRDPCYG